MATENTTHAAPSTNYRQYMKFGVLGPVRIENKGRHLSPGGPKQRTVLALLIARAGEPVSTDALMRGVYGDDAPPGSRRSVQTYISNLRSEIGDVITATGSGYTLVAERSEVDAFVFEDMVNGSTDTSDPEAIASRLREALALWRGHPYADVDGMAELTTEAARLNELRASALEERVAADLELGRHRDLVAELESLTEEYPLRERFRSQQMLALYRSGRQAEALRAYEKTRTYLVEEMGLDPSRELRDLERRILEQDPTLTFESGPAVRRTAVLVADVADPRMLPSLDPGDRAELIRLQADALEDAAAGGDGTVFAHRGSAMYLSFEDVDRAVEAASAAQQTLARIRHPMRMAISVGEVQIPQDGSVQGPPVTRAAQLVATAHGGQVLLSVEANQALVDSGVPGWIVRSLGQHDVDGSGEPRAVYQLMIDGLPREFPPLRTELLPPPLPIEVRGLPGYELREQVGSGAFGVVHRAYQPSVGREVAIKIIKPEYANDPDFIRHFEVEAQLVARLEHPHIVPLHDYWRTPEGAYLVMRWLGGGTLQDRIADGTLTIDDTHTILADIGPALAFAHRRGVVHRDIKPSNVLFDDEGDAYLADFGIARDITSGGVGNVIDDIQALAILLRRCLGTTDEEPVDQLLVSAVESGSFTDVRSFIAAWEEAVGAGGDTSQEVGYTPTRNPYKGLSAFGELDAADFHGRDAEIEEILSTLSEQRLVAVVGPSGIGKSSVVRAGMIPALCAGAIPGSERWLITDMLPGTYPYEELTSALIRVATETPTDLEEDLRRDARGLARSVKRYVPEDQTVLLVVDQFEELFTLSKENERVAFLAMLSATIKDDRSNIRIVITMRADFFDRPLRFADLGDALRAGTVPISAPGDEALYAIVTEPAAGVGVAFEPGLVDHIVGDVKHQPGALPLLEFSLTELFDQRDSDLLTLAAYEASGGVLGALGRRAETIYTDLDSGAKEAARETFLRLVNVGDAGRDTRRRVRLGELERLGFTDTVLRGMLEAFAAHRLFTFDRDPTTRGPTVEVAHEAILTEWPRLAAWIEDHREDLLLRSRLAVAVADWETAERADTYLLTGGRLDQHETWTADTDLTLTTAEREFLAASRTTEDERRARRRRTRRLVTTGFGIAAIIALILAIAALISRNETARLAEVAKTNETAAEANAALAEAKAAEAEDSAIIADQRAEDAFRSAATAQLRQASLRAESDPELATLLALATAQSEFVDDDQLAEVLHLTLQNWKLAARYDPGFFGLFKSIGLDRTGRYIAGVTEGGTINIWDDADQREPTIIGSWTSPILVDASAPPRFVPSEDGTRVASIGDDGTLRVWSTGSVGPVATIPLIDGPQGLPAYGFSPEQSIAFEPGGDRLAVVTWTAANGRTADLHIVDLEQGTVLDTVKMWEPYWIDWRPDGQLAVLIRFNVGGVYLFDPLNLPETDESGFPLDPDADILVATELHALEAALNEDASMAAYGALQGFVLADAATGETRLGPLELGGVIAFVEFSPDERLIAIGADSGRVTVLDVATGDRIAEFEGTNRYLSWGENGSTLRGIDANGESLVWDVTGKPSGEVWTSDLGDVLVTAMTSNGDRLAVMSRENPSMPGSLFVLDTMNGAVLREYPDRWGYGVMFTSDGTEILTQPGRSDDTGQWWGPFEALDAEGSVTRTYDAPCPDYWQQDCDENPEMFWFFSTSAQMSNDGSTFASAQGAIATWDVASGAHLATTAKEYSLADIVGFSLQDELIAVTQLSGQDPMKLTWFDPPTMSELRSVEVGTGYMVSPNGSLMISVGEDTLEGSSDDPGIAVFTVRDGQTGEVVGSVEADSAGIPFFSPSGDRFAIFDWLDQLTIWDTESLTMEQTLPLAAAYWEAMWLDETTIAMIYQDGAVIALTTETQDLVSSARAKVTRTLTAVECRDFDIDPCPTLEEIKAG